jgi:hypothetical protein
MDEQRDDPKPRADEAEDPGAYIGNQPEREAESIPGGVQPGDERIAAYDSRSGVEGEPDDPLGDAGVPADDGSSQSGPDRG